MGSIAGIDLGTTFSAVSVLDALGVPQIVANKDGTRLTPSAIFVKKDGSGCFVGESAVNSRKEYGCTDNCVRDIKRHMHESDYSENIMGHAYSPEEISAMILRKVAQGVDKIDNVVISVPALFGEAARSATMRAANLAGLNVVGIVNEPTAAALYYAKEKDIDGNVIIFDLGGGTFDVTAGIINGYDLEVKASSGSSHLGGRDFDQKLVDHFTEIYEKETGSPLYGEKSELAEIEDFAEEKKKDLSIKDSVNIRLRGTASTVRTSLKRSDFEEMISKDITKAMMCVETALDEAGWSTSDVDNVLLVGGSSRIPAFRNMLSDMFGMEPISSANVDECVALGASIYCGLRLMDENPASVPPGIAQALKSISLKEVTNKAFGTIAIGLDEHTRQDVRENAIIIKKNTRIPCSCCETFYTHVEGQQGIICTITQTDDNDATDPSLVRIVCTEDLELPLGLPYNAPIKVTYSYNSDGMMECVFCHEASNTVMELNIDTKSGNSGVEKKVSQKINTSKIIIE